MQDLENSLAPDRGLHGYGIENKQQIPVISEQTSRWIEWKWLVKLSESLKHDESFVLIG